MAHTAWHGDCPCWLAQSEFPAAEAQLCRSKQPDFIASRSFGPVPLRPFVVQRFPLASALPSVERIVAAYAERVDQMVQSPSRLLEVELLRSLFRRS